MIDSIVLIANDNGLPLYVKNNSKKSVDETLLLGFFSALKSFAASFMKENSEIKYIHIGDALLDFENVEFEDFGRVDVIFLSTGINASTSHIILSKITEQFAIYLDEVSSCNGEPIINSILKGKFLNCASFDPILAEILNNVESQDAVDVELHIDVPTSIFSMIKGIFTKNPGLDSTYENNPVNLLDQMFSQYAIDSLADDIKTQFKNIL
jgi:hypothetical protein